MTQYTQDSFVDIPMPSLVEAQDSYFDPEKDLERVKEYARQLWTQVTGASDYLRTGLARGGVLASDDQWLAWQEVYAGLLSVLAGPAGDSGYGQSQAVLERQHGQAH